FEAGTYVVASRSGQIKRLALADLKPWRTYKSKATVYMKLKGADDQVIAVAPIGQESVLVISHLGYALHFAGADVPQVGAKAAGVKAMNLKADDWLVATFPVTSETFYLLTQRGAIKANRLADFPLAGRAGRGLQVLKELKKAPHRVFMAGAIAADSAGILEVLDQAGRAYSVELDQLRLMERTSNGSFIDEQLSESGLAEAYLKVGVGTDK
ncbi:DNA gyrase C-terminal beta-propeller domain-containing protein, partial [Streptococcus danieliae]|uniref:DNA gyrase C-terminal beta-propeller domain-containing protein n=1 Tax=Streptococcus danieliae TaxID=747656 RepID=UPI0026F1622C